MLQNKNFLFSKRGKAYEYAHGFVVTRFSNINLQDNIDKTREAGKVKIKVPKKNDIPPRTPIFKY